MSNPKHTAAGFNQQVITLNSTPPRPANPDGGRALIRQLFTCLQLDRLHTLCVAALQGEEECAADPSALLQSDGFHTEVRVSASEPRPSDPTRTFLLKRAGRHCSSKTGGSLHRFTEVQA